MADINKIKEIMNDGNNAEAIAKCATVEQFLAYLKTKGVEATEADLKEILTAGEEGKLSMEDLNNVAGGINMTMIWNICKALPIVNTIGEIVEVGVKGANQIVGDNKVINTINNTVDNVVNTVKEKGGDALNYVADKIRTNF